MPALKGQCVADAGNDLTICDGDGTSSNYTYLDGTSSKVPFGATNYEWTVFPVVGDGSWRETLVITSGESDEPDPRFKYPYQLAEDTEFFVYLRIFDDSLNCESFDTLSVYVHSNMCPRPNAGADEVFSNGCDFTLTLNGSDSEDEQGEVLSYYWRSLDGLDDGFLVQDSVIGLFEFPSTDEDNVYFFELTVTDAIRSVSDTVRINYLDNDVPVANAGADFSTCDYQFNLSGSQSYDVNWNELTYEWLSLEGLSITGANTIKPTITSPVDLATDTEYYFSLKVSDGYCNSHDTVKVLINDNLCPVAIAGETIRLAKFESTTIVLNASQSFDPDGETINYEWHTPSGLIIYDSIVTVIDEDPSSRYSSYQYILKVIDAENSISTDSIAIIYSNFSAPLSPAVYGVGSHGRILVSWGASSEASYDSLTGYSDFEGYKLYRSIDGGLTWGGESDKLYDFNGEFVGWRPYAQFDYDYYEDFFHCIYQYDGECESEDMRQTSVSGLDPYLPRFTLGSNTGLEYSFIDSNVIDGVEYTYTVTAYDMGLPKFELTLTESDSSGIFNADTIWPLSNPGHFVGPDSVSFYDESNKFLRKDANPYRGLPFLESAKGSQGDDNFITVIPGYTALDISFPDANDTEALFTSSEINVGTGKVEYFIVDRSKIVQDKIKYEIQAEQGSQAVEGMACENPLVFGYTVDEVGEPITTTIRYEEDLNFFEKDSIDGLPGVIYDDGIYSIPDYNIISPLGKWSDQFKGIRYKISNSIPLNISAVPPVNIDSISYIIRDSSAWADSIDVAANIFPQLSYTNVASYLRRLNFDYNIEFFADPVDGTIIPITNTSGQGQMYLPFKITNLSTGKEVGLGCNDFGTENASPIDFSNGASNFVWDPGEEVFLIKDSLRISGEWIETYNYNLNLLLFYWFEAWKDYDDTKDYGQGDYVFFQGSVWYAEIPASANVQPQSIFNDLQDDGERNNPWRPFYPWLNRDQMILIPNKLFVDGDNWYSDMSKLGEKIGISDTLCLDSIKVVPNPYKASSKYNETPDMRRIRFTHLPTECRISIYTISGEHVTSFNHEQQFDGNAWWNLRSGNNQTGPEIAPGLYIYVIEFPEKKDYCIDTYDSDGDVQGSLKNDFYSNNNYDNEKFIKNTKFHIGKFAVIR